MTGEGRGDPASARCRPFKWRRPSKASFASGGMPRRSPPRFLADEGRQPGTPGLRGGSMNRHEQRIVQFLSRPSSYPHPVDRVERRQTHVSHVFLAGSFAYKLKKPVRFPFLDASALSERKRFCQLELSLNRRLAPQTYLGIVPITESRGALRLGGTGRAVEWVVKMNRLPDQRMLDRVIAARRAHRRDLEAVADRLIPFFHRAARSQVIDRYGTPTAIAELVLDNLRECQPFVGRVCSEDERRFLESAYRQYLTLHEPLLSHRVGERRIID